MRPIGNVFSMPALTVALAAVLGGCESSAYVMDQLGEIPTPQSALLKRLPKPNCNTDARVEARTTGNEFTGTARRKSIIAMTAKTDAVDTPEDKIATAGDGEAETPAAEAKKESGKRASDKDGKPRELADGKQKQAEKDAKTGEAGAGAQKKREETSPKAAKKEKTSSDSKDPVNKKNVVQNLKDERDCYRSAENRVHNRLNKLQASTVETVAAVNRMKKKYQHAATLHSHQGSVVTTRLPGMP